MYLTVFHCRRQIKSITRIPQRTMPTLAESKGPSPGLPSRSIPEVERRWANPTTICSKYLKQFPFSYFGECPQGRQFLPENLFSLCHAVA